MRTLMVCEGPDDDATHAADELRADGWQIVDSFEVAGGVPPGAKICCVGNVTTSDEAGRAVLAAVRGAAVIVRARGPRDVIDLLCEDLRRVGTLEHFTGSRPRSPLDAEQTALLKVLLDGNTLGEAATRLHLSRRSADRRLHAARAALGVETTTEALLEARRRGFV